MKPVLKIIARSIAIVIISPLLLGHFLALPCSKSGLFLICGQLLSLIPGTPGSYCRVAFYRFAMTKCDSECVIGFATLFSQIDTEVDHGVYIGPQCNVGSCSIGKQTLVASGVHILSGKEQHGYQDLELPIQDQPGNFEKISIGEDCWIGNGSLVMANIGSKCIIGAGSVVINDIPDYSIAAGNPARVIRSRLDT